MADTITTKLDRSRPDKTGGPMITCPVCKDQCHPILKIKDIDPENKKNSRIIAKRDCGHTVCYQCYKTCAHCHNAFCRTCIQRCSVCAKFYCKRSMGSGACDCSKPICPSCIDFRDECGKCARDWLKSI